MAFFVDGIPYTIVGNRYVGKQKVWLKKTGEKHMNKAVIVEAKRTPIGKKEWELFKRVMKLAISNAASYVF